MVQVFFSMQKTNPCLFRHITSLNWKLTSHVTYIGQYHLCKSKARTEKFCKIFECLLFPSGRCFVQMFVCLFFSLNVVEVRTILTGFTRNGLQMNWGIIQCRNLAVLKAKLTVTLMSQNTLIQSMQRYYCSDWSLLNEIFM